MRRIIQKMVLKVIVLGAIFVGAVIGFSLFMNQAVAATSLDMKEATLPLVSVRLQETLVNKMHGYTREMKPNLMRDTVTPVPSDKILSLVIENYGKEVSEVIYEIISPIDNSVVETKRVTALERLENEILVQLELENNMRMNQEYVLKITLMVDGREVYYYTRILQQERLFAGEYIAFINSFFDLCLDKNVIEMIEPFIEADYTGDNTTLAKVNIHSMATQFTWGEMDIQVKIPPVPQIKEINGTTAYFVLDYVISSMNEEGEEEFFEVKEFYRMRYMDSKVVLLNFERTVEEIIKASSSTISGEGIHLGITSGDTTYKTNAEGTVVSFVQAGDLWQYNKENHQLTQVFTFRDRKYIDERQAFRQNNINIINVDEDGNTDFIVYGYMNRGEHEGCVGIAVYRLEAGSGNVEEKIFIPYDEPYEMLKLDMGKLSYISEEETLFFMLGGSVFQVELVSREYIVIVSELKEGDYALSEEGNSFAWVSSVDGQQDNSINIMNFDDGSIYTILAPVGEIVSPLGFMGEDFIYGLAKSTDVMIDTFGKRMIPMHTLIIRNNNEIVKTYTIPEIYVTAAEVEDKLVTLTRVKKTETSFVEEVEDYIMNNETRAEGFVTISKRYSDIKQTERLLVFSSAMSERKAKIVRTKFEIFEQSRELPLQVETEITEKYYVYGNGQLDSIYESANLAVTRANEILGVVVNSRLEYIWIRGDLKQEVELDLEKIPDIMKQGTMDFARIATEIDGVALNLSGCTLEEIRYFVSAGYPVVVQAGADVLTIVGYDQWLNTILYNPQTNSTYKYADDDSEELFGASGNKFISYIDKSMK